MPVIIFFLMLPIWRMFGIANQLLATVALAVGTTCIIAAGRRKYAWVTAVPMTFLAISTISAGILSVKNNFWPMATGPNEALHLQGYMNSGLTVLMLVCVLIIGVAAVRRWMVGPAATSAGA